MADDVLLIANSKNSWPELRDALRAVTPGTRLSRQAAVKAGLAQGANSGELQEVLGVSQKVVDRLRRSSQLDSARTSGTINSHQVFEAVGLDQLRSLFQDRISIGAVAERLDISRHGLEQVACLGLIEFYEQAAMRTAFVQRQAKKSDYVRLLRDLNEAGGTTDTQDTSPSQANAEGNITMHVAMKIIGGREKPWGPVILAMLSGELPFQLDRSHDGRFMSRVSLAIADLPKLASFSFDDRALSGFEFEPLINGRDTEEFLHIYPKALQAAKQKGVFPKPTNGSYDRQVIRDLALRYVSPAEVLARCNLETESCRRASSAQTGWSKSRL